MKAEEISNQEYAAAVLTNPCEGFWDTLRFPFNLFILIAGVVANILPLRLFLQEWKSLSASQVLGVSLVGMDLIYLSLMPVRLVYDIYKPDLSLNSSDMVDSLHSMQTVMDVSTVFNMVGCPLLLTCMCIERYLAVNRPVLYVRLRKWEYRVAVSAVVWCVTLCFCLATGFLRNSGIIVILVSVIISFLFVLMLACLGGVVRSLRQQSPAHRSNGNTSRSESRLKRQAAVNVLVVVVPSVLTYLPVLAMLPLYIYILSGGRFSGGDFCAIVELSTSFPRSGVFIGPMFYLSKTRHMCSLCRPAKICCD